MSFLRVPNLEKGWRGRLFEGATILNISVKVGRLFEGGDLSTGGYYSRKCCTPSVRARNFPIDYFNLHSTECALWATKTL